MSPALFAGVDTTDNVEWIDTEQRGLVLRVRRGRLVWFVRYVFEGAPLLAWRAPSRRSLRRATSRSVVRGRAAASDSAWRKASRS
jgi:hypothetical protein